MYKHFRSLTLVITILSAFYLVIQTVSLGQSSALWGASLTCYFDWPIRSLIAVAALACSLATVLIGSILTQRTDIRKLLVNYIMPLVLIGIFFLLRVKTHYLGDGLLRGRELEIGVWWLPTEPLAQAANYVIYWLTSSLFGMDGIDALELVSYLGGLFYYFTLIGFVKTVVRDDLVRLLVFVVLYVSGMTVLFCGYAETYMLIPGLMALFFTLGIKAIRGESSPLLACLFFLLLTLFHFKSLMLAPCIGLLAYFNAKAKQHQWTAFAVFVVLAAIVAVVVLPGLSFLPTLSTADFALPLTSGGSDYTVFSTQHLLDVANQLLLTSAAAVILILSWLLIRGKESIWKSRALMFIGAALPGAVAMLLLLHSRLGFAVDWDLFSSASLVVSFFAVMLCAETKEPHLSRIATVSVSTVAFLSFFAFAAVNANSEVAVRRQVDILSLYGKEGAIGFESMGNHLNSIGRTEEALQMWRRSIALRPHVRMYANMAQLSLNEGRLTDAKYYSEMGLQLDSTHATLWNHLGVALTQMGEFRSAEAALTNAVHLNPNSGYFHHNYAILLVQVERWSEAEEQLRQAIQLLPGDPTVMLTLGLTLTYTGKLKEAESILTQVATFAPANGESYFYLSRTFLLQSDTTRARQVLTDYLSRYPNSPTAPRMQNVLEQLK